MTAPRTCRGCEAPLAGNVRWCLRCYEPARELTPRASVWEPGTFVEAPIVRGPSVAHWSRWEKTSTTFGPIGRIAWTGVVVSFVLSSLTGNPLLLLFELPIAAVVLHSIWARGWFVPEDRATLRLRDLLPDERPSTWLHDVADIKQTLWLSMGGLAVMSTIMYGPPIAKCIAVATAVVGCGYAFFRGWFGRF